ncbi:MAG: hypothetical protein QOF23_1012 [Solirubrobacterales bacterium]|nr:hypothetical protein [Solirubrobacterales bacterium]
MGIGAAAGGADQYRAAEGRYPCVSSVPWARGFLL